MCFWNWRLAMRCEDARGLQVDRLLDTLDGDDLARLEEHERGCSECSRVAEEIVSPWGDLARMTPPTPDSQVLIRFGRRMGRGTRRPDRMRALVAAGMVAMLGTGAVLGRASAPAVAPDVSSMSGSHFLLVLRGAEPAVDIAREQLVGEYTAWASDLSRDGSLVAGAELAADGGRWVGLDDPAGDGGIPVSGFFLVSAEDYDAAVAIARGSPHLAFGGVIEVRRIVESP